MQEQRIAAELALVDTSVVGQEDVAVRNAVVVVVHMVGLEVVHCRVVVGVPSPVGIKK